ncbi:tetratricopeptide repeat protein [Fundidesulfovibrio soli]|uniref:tetratricopeptide repeat protein n=1 Tax=Fundidesulfovibrio soli TaxID=2922716 RepID=UPI001FAF67FE|nr:tetratricopeptide repeat protein [Fundidesulfovibrio soli]
MSLQKALNALLAALALPALLLAGTSPARAQTALDELFMSQEWQARGNMAEARRSVQSALRIAPMDSYALVRLAQLDALMGGLDAAEDGLKAVLEADPDNVLALIWLGHVKLALGFPATALAAYSRAASLDPQNGWAQLGAASSLLAQERGRQAAPLLAKAQEAAGDDAALHFALGETFLAMGLPVNARLELERALDLDARNTQGLVLAGRAYLRLGMDNLALNAWRQALAFEPQSGAARLAVVTVLGNQARKALAEGKREEAEHLWRGVLGYDPQDQQARDGLAALAGKGGKGK